MRAARKSAKVHYLYVGNIITHVGNFLVLQSVAFTEILVIMHFDRRTQVDILRRKSQCQKTMTYRLGTSTGYDTDQQSLLHCQLQSVTVFYVQRTQWLTFRIHGNDIRTQYTIYIKQQRLDPSQIVINGTHISNYFI